MLSWPSCLHGQFTAASRPGAVHATRKSPRKGKKASRVAGASN